MKDVPERSSLWSRLRWFAMLYVGGVLAALSKLIPVTVPPPWTGTGRSTPAKCSRQ